MPKGPELNSSGSEESMLERIDRRNRINEQIVRLGECLFKAAELGIIENFILRYPDSPISKHIIDMLDRFEYSFAEFDETLESRKAGVYVKHDVLPTRKVKLDEELSARWGSEALKRRGEMVERFHQEIRRCIGVLERGGYLLVPIKPEEKEDSAFSYTFAETFVPVPEKIEDEKNPDTRTPYRIKVDTENFNRVDSAVKKGQKSINFIVPSKSEGNIVAVDPLKKEELEKILNSTLGL